MDYLRDYLNCGMPYRIVQIRKPYDYHNTKVTVACYDVDLAEYETPEKAREEIKFRSDGKYPYGYAAPEDWFIIIQTF